MSCRSGKVSDQQPNQQQQQQRLPPAGIDFSPSEGYTENSNGNDLDANGGKYLRRPVPRYIQIPDDLYLLRHRFPIVLQSIFLECTRCLRWVPVEVFSAIPDEVLEAGAERRSVTCDSSGIVSPPADGKGCTTGKGALYSLSADQTQRGLGDSLQEIAQQREWGSMTSGVTNEGANGQTKWHSPRLREHMQRIHQALPSKPPASGDRSDTHCDVPNRPQEVESDTDRAERILLLSLTGGGSKPPSGCGNSAATKHVPWIEQREPPQSRCRSSTPLQLYIPNPACFTCGWLSCQQADLLTDLRQTWLGALYKATTPAGPTASEETRVRPVTPQEKEGNKFLTSSFMPLHEVVLTLQEHKDALNANLARELDCRRSDRLMEERNKRRKHFQLSQTSGSLSMGATAVSSSADIKNPSSGNHDDKTLALLVLSEEEKFKKGRHKVGLHSLEHLRNAWLRSALRHLAGDQLAYDDDDAESVALSAFCWVVCERCGKLRRVAQPFPGGVPFICALSRSVGTCSVSELDGLIAYTADLTEAALRRVTLASPFLPYSLKQHCAQRLKSGRNLGLPTHNEFGGEGDQNRKNTDDADAAVRALFTEDEEPLLKTFRSEVGRRLLVLLERAANPQLKVASSRSQRRSHGCDTMQGQNLIEGALPLLKELSALMRKRFLGTFAKQILTTPQEIRTKRNDVSKAFFMEEPEEARGENAIVETNLDQLSKGSQKATRGHPDATAATAAVPDKPSLTSIKMHANVQEDVVLERDIQNRTRGRQMNEAKDQAPFTCMNKRQNGDASNPVESLSEPKNASIGMMFARSDGLDNSSPSGRQSSLNKGMPLSQKKGEPPSLRGISVSVKVENGVPVKRKRGRPPKHDAKDKHEIVHWVQCDLCGKWRIVPHRIPESTSFWECNMRNDETTCATLDDADTFEKVSDEQKNKKKRTLSAT